MLLLGDDSDHSSVSGVLHAVVCVCVCGDAFKDRCRCDLNITPKNKTGGYKRKNGAVQIKGGS